MYEESYRVCAKCEFDYAEYNNNLCLSCGVNEMLAEREANEAAARRHYGEIVN